jgi:23S rRNA (cytidine1920-2'-O)/16S rRNA (cytidine1409-2'-O)-methyltransferase
VSDTTRLDSALVARGIAQSRTKAQRRIAEGDVSLNGVVNAKPATPVTDSDVITMAGGHDYVGRGALKLRTALEEWGINAEDLLCVDIGASTGGFTEVLLAAKAQSVLALDVGHDQLHPSLRDDPRVTSLEGVNIRHVTPQWWEQQGGGSPDLIVADVSFISLTHVLPPAVSVWPGASWVVLVKPQFEVGRTSISGGLSINPDDHESAVSQVLDCATELGLYLRGVLASPITGERGNREYLCWFTPAPLENPPEWGEEIHALTHP